jgi:Right handed beta helix region
VRAHRIFSAVILLLASLGARTARDPARDPLEVATSAELEEALSGSRRNAVILLAPGVYELTPESAIDSTCGNCTNPDTLIPVTVGMTISGRNVRIEGPDDGSATVVTHAGYGLYFKDCRDCELERVTVTGGERDTSGAATDAAVVVTRSSVTIRDCVIRDNIGSAEIISTHIVGIMGICGREGADLTIERCDILRNSWDGIALYRDARATISNNVIDGVDAAGVEAGGGRGVAIGITWNGSARIQRNLIQRYWKGIGIFVDANVIVYGNIVEEMRTWGINVWDAETGHTRAIIERNVVYDCGACGIAITRHAEYAAGEEHGRLTSNIVVHTGQNPKYDSPDIYCYQCALALHAVPEGFTMRGNAFFDNREASDDLFEQDTTREMFWRERRGWVRTFRNTGVGAGNRVKFHQSAFLTEYPRWWD